MAVSVASLLRNDAACKLSTVSAFETLVIFEAKFAAVRILLLLCLSDELPFVINAIPSFASFCELNNSTEPVCPPVFIV